MLYNVKSYKFCQSDFVSKLNKKYIFTVFSSIFWGNLCYIPKWKKYKKKQSVKYQIIKG